MQSAFSMSGIMDYGTTITYVPTKQYAGLPVVASGAENYT